MNAERRRQRPPIRHVTNNVLDIVSNNGGPRDLQARRFTFGSIRCRTTHKSGQLKFDESRVSENDFGDQSWEQAMNGDFAKIVDGGNSISTLESIVT